MRLLLHRMFGRAKDRMLVSVGCAMWTRTNCRTLRGCIRADVEELFNGFTNDAFKDTSMSDPFKATDSNSSRNSWFFSWGHYRSTFTLRYKKSLRLLFPILFCATPSRPHKHNLCALFQVNNNVGALYAAANAAFMGLFGSAPFPLAPAPGAGQPRHQRPVIVTCPHCRTEYHILNQNSVSKFSKATVINLRRERKTWGYDCALNEDYF